MRTILRCGAVFDGVSPALRRDAVIVVEDGSVAAVEDENVAALEGRVIEATGLVAIPGLVDSHVHLTGDTNERQLCAERDPGRLTPRVARNVHQALRAGLTTLRDCGGIPGPLLEARRAIREGRQRGPDILTCGLPITTTRGHMSAFGVKADTERELVEAVRRVRALGADFVKVAVTGGGGTTGTDVFASSYGPRELGALCGEAHRLGMRVAAHVHGTDGIRACTQAGVDFLEHCSWLSPGGVAFDEDVARAIAARSCRVGVTAGALHRRPLAGHRSELREVWSALRREYPRLVRRMGGLGIPIAVGTDAGVWRSPFDRFHLALEELVFEGGYTPLEALVMATSGSSRALGLADRGVLAPGKRADLVLIDGDPTADVRCLARVKLTMVGGKVVYRARDIGSSNPLVAPGAVTGGLLNSCRYRPTTKVRGGCEP